jgi:hypothetical protein
MRAMPTLASVASMPPMPATELTARRGTVSVATVNRLAENP